MEELGIASVFATLCAGLLSFLSPCTLPVLPVYVAFLAGSADDARRGVARTVERSLAFVAGISVVYVALGLGAGALGQLVRSATLTAACGVIVTFFGIYLTGIIRIPALERESHPLSPTGGTGLLGAFVLGLSMSLSWTPCVGPVLAAVIALAASSQGAAAGAVLLAIYALGLGMPFVALALGSNLLVDRVRGLAAQSARLRVTGGVVIACLGVAMTFGAFRQAIDIPAGETHSVTEATGDAAAERPFDFDLRSMTGEQVSLDTYAGRPLLVKFWATWCGPCTADIDQFDALAAEGERTGDFAVATIVAPGMGRELSVDGFELWYLEHGLSFTVLYDVAGGVNARFGIDAYPTYVFYDADGQVFDARVGAIEADRLRDMLLSDDT